MLRCEVTGVTQETQTSNLFHIHAFLLPLAHGSPLTYSTLIFVGMFCNLIDTNYELDILVLRDTCQSVSSK